MAEGVETRTQRDSLRAQGCDRVRGYLLGQPLPAPECQRLRVPPSLSLRPEHAPGIGAE